jgi:hypothetical protein
MPPARRMAEPGVPPLQPPIQRFLPPPPMQPAPVQQRPAGYPDFQYSVVQPFQPAPGPVYFDPRYYGRQQFVYSQDPGMQYRPMPLSYYQPTEQPRPRPEVKPPKEVPPPPAPKPPPPPKEKRAKPAEVVKQKSIQFAIPEPKAVVFHLGSVEDMKRKLERFARGGKNRSDELQNLS